MRCSVPALSTSLNTCCKPRAAIIVSGYSTSSLKSYDTSPQLSIPSVQPLTLHIFIFLLLFFSLDLCAHFSQNTSSSSGAATFSWWPSGLSSLLLHSRLEPKINSISNAVISLMKSQCLSLIGELPRGQSEGWVYQRAGDSALGGRRPLMIKQDAVECVQPATHYYPACALNVSRRRRDDSIDLMKVLFIFSQILSPVITEALQHCHQPVPQFLKCTGSQVFFLFFLLPL